MSIQTLLSELNDSQRAASELPRQHALVLAGAGCGKTKTVVARAAWLISQTTPADRLQVLTFTRRAAIEIVERVRTHLGDAAVGLHASTFHTWCLSLMRRAPNVFGYRNFTVLDRDDQLSLFKLFRGKNPGKHFPTAAQICDLYSFARNTCQSLEVTLEIKSPDLVKQFDQIAEVMIAYEKRKRDRKYLDYDDILDVVAKRISASQDVRQWVGSLYDHILVDEVQDTNPLQWELLTPLQDSVTLFCVGDDAQSIYAFRGADFWSVHSFSERVKNSVTLKLEQNYRSTQEILDVSNWLISKSPLNYDKMLIANRGVGRKPQLHTFSSDWEEARWIADDILERKRVGAPWRHHMILVRTSWAASKIQGALLAKNIPYVFIGGVKLLESAHIRDVLSVLRVVANLEDEIGWMRFLALWPGVGEVTATKLTEEMIAMGEIDRCVNALANDSRISPAAEVVAAVRDLRVDVAKAFMVATQKLQPILSKLYHQDWDKRQLDFPLVEGLATGHGVISDFLEQYVLDPVWGTGVLRNDADDVVTVITVHSAKGMERETCYVINVSPGAFPLTKVQGDFDQVEEERRVLYVALTRAKDDLIVTRNVYSQWVPEEQQKDEDLCPVAETYFLNKLPENLFDHHLQKSVAFKSNTNDAECDEPPHVGIAIKSPPSERQGDSREAKEKNYMVRRDGVDHGPLSLVQLEMSLRLKKLKRSDLISKVGSNEWISSEQMFKFDEESAF
jgi:DNA helicase-2/ATP-dependent DNA helicase PcrA